MNENKQITQINLGSDIFNVGATADNVFITDEEFLNIYNNDIVFTAAMFNWKKSLLDNYPTLAMQDLSIARKNTSDGIETYALVISNQSFYGYYSGIDCVLKTSSAETQFATQEEVLNTFSVEKESLYVTLEEFVKYLLNTDVATSFSSALLAQETTPESLNDCENLYQVIKYLNANIGEPKDRIYNVTDYSNPQSIGLKTTPRTEHSDGIEDAPQDVDIVLIEHEDETKGVAPAKSQNVRIYKADGSAEFGKAYANGKTSMALGDDAAKANGDYSSVFGQGVSTTQNGSMAVGSYNIGNTNAMFSVGNGEAGAKNDAFRVNKNGSVYAQSTVTIDSKDSGTKDKIELVVKDIDKEDGFTVDKSGNIVSKGHEILDDYLLIDGNDTTNDNVLDVNVSEEKALTVDVNKDTTIYHDLKVKHDANIDNDLLVSNDATIKHNETVENNLTVKGSIVEGEASLSDTIKADNRNSYINDAGNLVIGQEPYPGNRIYSESYTHGLHPSADLTYNLGIKGTVDENGVEHDYLRWKKLYVGDIDASGDIVADNIKANGLDVSSDQNDDASGVPTFEFTSNLYPSKHDIFSLGDYNKKWLDGYYSGRLFSESVNTESMSHKFGEYFRLRAPRKADSDYKYPPDTVNYAIGKSSELGSNQRLVLYNKKSGVSGAKENYPEIKIDYATGNLEFVWAGYTHRALKFYPHGKGPTKSGQSGQGAGYHTRPVYPVFHYGSLIAAAIGRSIPLTCFVNGSQTITRYMGYIKCGVSTDGKKALNDFINTYSRKESESPIFYYHNMYCFTKRHNYPRRVIEYYKSKRNEWLVGELKEDGTRDITKSLSNAYSNLYRAWDATMTDFLDAEKPSKNRHRGCIYLDSMTSISKDAWVCISGKCHTNLDYENLVFIKHLLDILSQNNSTKYGAIDKLFYNYGSKFFWGVDDNTTAEKLERLKSDLIAIYGSEENIPTDFPTKEEILTDSFEKENDGYTYTASEIEVGELDENEESADEDSTDSTGDSNEGDTTEAYGK